MPPTGLAGRCVHRSGELKLVLETHDFVLMASGCGLSLENPLLHAADGHVEIGLSGLEQRHGRGGLLHGLLRQVVALFVFLRMRDAERRDAENGKSRQTNLQA